MHSATISNLLPHPIRSVHRKIPVSYGPPQRWHTNVGSLGATDSVDMWGHSEVHGPGPPLRGQFDEYLIKFFFFRMKFWRLDGALGASRGNLMDVLGSSTAPRPHPAAWPGRYSRLQSRLPAWLNITKFTRPAPPQHPQKPQILVRFSRDLRGSWAAGRPLGNAVCDST